MVYCNGLLEKYGVKGSFGWMGETGSGFDYFVVNEDGDTVLGDWREGLRIISQLEDREGS